MNKLKKPQFCDCSGLESIVFPAGVRLVEADALTCHRESALEKVTFLNPKCEINLGRITHVDPDSAKMDELDFTGIIRGYEGSTAEAYAKANSYTFEAIGEAAPPAPGDVNDDGVVDAEDVRFLLGDLTGDGAVSVDDAQLTLRAYAAYVAGSSGTLTDAQRNAADINKDGEVFVDDAQLILKYYILRDAARYEVTWQMLTEEEFKADLSKVHGK